MSRAKMGNLTPIESRDLQRMQDPSSSCALSDDLARKEDLQQMHRGVLAQIEREEETRCSAPDAYRLSLMSDAAVTGVYRRGKDYMSSADLLRYAREARSAHLAQVDLSRNTGVDECPCKNEQSDTNVQETAMVLADDAAQTGIVSTVVKQIKSLPQRIREGIPLWFDTRTADTSADTRRFPLSAFAAVLVIALSLMLIVASSVLLNRAEDNVSRMKLQVSKTSEEVMEMRSELEASIDLLEIRRIAMEEYGMVEEEYLKMDYISLQTEDSVESFPDERSEGVGLSALLSAIGIKK